MPKTVKGGFYAVSKGRTTGVFLTWEECEAQVKGFTGARYKKFTNAAEAEQFVGIAPAALAGTGPSASHAGASTSGEQQKAAGTSTRPRSSSDVEDESGWDVVYCDGACKGNGREGSVAGVGVWWGRDDPRNIAERCPGDQTNNRAELIAIVRILETTPITPRPLLIKSDSKYSINCFKLWLPKWIANDFRTSTGEPVKNPGIIRYLSALLDERARAGQRVRLQYVRGHCGEEGNEGADALANRGAFMPTIPERNWAALERDARARLEAPQGARAGKVRAAPVEVHDADVAIAVKPVQGVTKTKSMSLVPLSTQDTVYQEMLAEATAPTTVVASVDIKDIDLNLFSDVDEILLSDEELNEMSVTQDFSKY